MASPPNFLGFALASIAARQRAREEAQRNALAQQQIQENQHRYDKAQQDKAFGNALQLIQAGRDPEAVFNLYGDQLRYGDLKFLKAEAKAIQQQGPPIRSAERKDLAEGAAANLMQPGDPLQNFLAAARGTPAGNEGMRIIQQAGAIAAAQRAQEQARTQYLQTQSDITEQRQTRMLGKKSAMRGAPAPAGGVPPKPVPPAVQSAYDMYRASGQNYQDWVDNKELPASVYSAATRHPDFTPVPLKTPANLGTVPQGLPEGPFTPVPGLLPPVPSQAPAPQPAVTEPKPGQWIEISPGVRVRKR